MDERRDGHGNLIIPFLVPLRLVPCTYNGGMPPPATNRPNATDTGHMLSEHNRPVQKSGVGHWIGIVIIVALLGFGALYFYGAYLNIKSSSDQLPLIPGDTSTEIPE